jgi:hypothetical protein
MNITHKQAVLLFQELGFRNADKYTVERLNSKLADIRQHFTNDEPMDTDEGRALLKQVFAAQEAGKTVTVTATPTEAAAEEAPAPKKKKAAAPVEDEEEEPAAPAAKPKAAPVEEEEEAAPEPAAATAKGKAAPAAEEEEEEAPAPKKKKKDAGKKAEEIVKASAKAKPAAEEAPAPKKKKAAAKSDEGIETDRYGNRVDSDLAKINKTIGAKGKDLTAITKESGVRRGRCRRQLRKLVAKKLVAKSKEGLFTHAKDAK